MAAYVTDGWWFYDFYARTEEIVFCLSLFPVSAFILPTQLNGNFDI